ncbi:MAG: hypothetical protein IJ894_11430, partial [Bacteroidales bacterium]|nr:hypothetical protein [Bacteroidales bacterium]
MKTLQSIILAAAIALPSVVYAQDEHIVTYYDKNETVKKSEGDMKDGHENGRWTYYYRNGKKYKETDFYMGVVNGRVAFYYENGNLMNEGNVVNNRTTGAYKEYYEDATLKAEGFYDNNKKDSLWKYYNIVGRLITVENCKDGQCITKDAFDNSGTQMVKDGNGEFKAYYPDEKTVQEQGS